MTSSLQVYPPLGINEKTLEFIPLDKDQVVFAGEKGDIVLPNPYKTITRERHCVLKRQANDWLIIDDKPSTNGTYLYRVTNNIEIDLRKSGPLVLENEDIILIPGMVSDCSEVCMWKLRFIKYKTNSIPQFQITHLEYSLSQKNLVKLYRRKRTEIPLTIQECALVDYMARRNADNNQPVVCTYTELILAIWGDEINHGKNEVNHLVHRVRRKIEFNLSKPEFLLKDKQGRGYMLMIKMQA
ncbi:winged helix-turn-helix domain-containing protein [Nostoc spongiaeforme FACHB-130]|uniref:Winged helix-turn-helix domain-containing protein n=1 Tax=Nostoc spongiaeforme FACHB-130 TaxID=1357510 RepID=A0ABR8G4V3_9NOSO|nr:winged helix-turn-helix domain-containing protein [Nostoc spongiaeforme]MBD2598308.1 winged helix-turn-helix domain-containing protein [Nostoc spongiaeforme FACHB-130]